MFRTAVLVVHGFCGGLWENENLVNYLQFDKKLDVYAYTLPNHTNDFTIKANYNDWISDSEKHLVNLLKKYKRVILIGHSMGGVIASFLATKYKVKKLILVSPAFEYLNFTKNIEDIKHVRDLNKEKKGYSLYKEFASKFLRYSPFFMGEFIKLVKKYKETIKDVKCKTLIIHGDADELVPITSSLYALDNIGTDKKYIKIVSNVRHRVFKSEKSDKISEYILCFIKGGLKWKRMKNKEI